ncbi:MAG TPA: O-antigen ligase family protein [Pyrinomonadaceae bacterium]|nr:O-antigen ligase family protein [Pyrinomonadaceae bacterium]
MTNSNLNVLEKTESKTERKQKAAVLVEPETTLASRLVFFVLSAAIVLTTLLYGAVHPPVIALFWASAALIVVLWAADALRGGALRLNRSLLQIPLAGAAIFGIIQVMPFGSADTAGVSAISRTISFDSYSTLIAVIQFVVLLIYLAATLAFVDSSKRLRFLVYFITIFGFVFAFFAIIQNLLDPGRIYGVYERPYMQPFGSFVNKHNFAAFIEMAIALPLGLLFTGAVEKEKRLLYLTAVGLMGVALTMSGSRGGLVALIAEIVFLIAIATKTHTTRDVALKVALAGVLLATIIGGTILIGGDSTLTRIAETAASKDPTSSRLQIWDTSWKVIQQSPILGSGFGAFGTAYTQFDPLNGRERVEQAHNDYLQIVADAGIIGVVLGAFFVFVLFRDGFRRLKSKDNFRRGVAVGALAGCFAILVHSLFDFVLHTSAISLLFLVLAALATLNGQVESEGAAERKNKRRKASVVPIESKRKQKELNESSGTA